MHGHFHHSQTLFCQMKSSDLIKHIFIIEFLLQLKVILDGFNDFYINHQKGRKLISLHQYSKGELEAYFTNRKYIFQVCTYLFIIFSDGKSYMKRYQPIK